MKEITPNEVVKNLNENKTVHIVDVRENEEVATGIIPNATHISLGSLEQRVDELDKTKEYVVVCRSGRRSAMACEFLESKGYQVANMVGGMLDWEGPIE